MTPHLRIRSRRRGGFTLVELMIAMTIGLFVVGGAYYITRTTSRMFAEQLRRSETQLTLRGAVEMMRRDIARAGFAGVRTTGEMPGCNNTSTNVGAAGTVGATMTDVSPVALAAVWVEPANAARPARLYVSGNYSTSDQYLVDGGASTPDRIVFQMDQYAFLRSFVMPTPGGPQPANAFLETRFRDAFLAVGDIPRLVNVQDLRTRKSFLRLVRTVNANVAPPNLELATQLPLGSGCNWALDSAVVAPISMYRYEVADTRVDLEAAAAVGAAGTYMSGGDRFVLVRREINVALLGQTLPPAVEPQPIPGTTRAIVDFVDPNGFTVEGVHDSSLQNTRSLQNLQRVPRMGVTWLDVDPASLRTLVIQIIARSAEERAGAAHEQSRAAAGQRVARFEVFMPNLSRNPGRR